MYTQCPECGTAFRVTAEVLRQASGRVRCGGCRNAFNALDYLSEQKPVKLAPPPREEEPVEPEPEPPQLEADESPEVISAERSAALLKTLDELAGSDVRIEDTGIEWRVLDAGDDDDTPQEADDDTGSMRWFIDESPTPVDEQLSAEPGDIDAPEIFEPVKGAEDAEEMRFDDDTPLPEDFDFDSESAERGSAPAIEVREGPAEPDTGQVDLALGEPEDWEELLGEVAEVDDDEDDRAHKDTAAETEVTVIAAADEDSDQEDEEPLPDVDTQFATQAEAMGIDLSGLHAQAEDRKEKTVEAGEEATIDDDLIAAAFEAEAEERAPDDEDQVNDNELNELEVDEFELDLEEPADLIEPRDRELVARTEEDEILAMELGLEDEEDEDEARSEPVVPPMTEEEQTINRMIDQDLLAFAVKDEHGCASAIIQKQRPEADEVPEVVGEGKPAPGTSESDDEETGPLVETIIMEGEFVRDAFDEERLEEERRKSAEAEAEARESPATVTGETEKSSTHAARKPANNRLVAGIVALAMLLGVQYLHQSRESLAVYPAFSDSVGSIYRVLGKPVTPAWDITGWRFEATKGSTDESDKVLTIYSRIGNNSAEALPYPLINVSLTDRYEDIIGSKVLEPGDYLAESLGTREHVAPGETFSAVISIEAPDANATGFKLNVCYRQPGRRLRCAIDDFK